MTHYIIAKFKDESDTERLLPEITELYNRTLELDGVEKVVIHKVLEVIVNLILKVLKAIVSLKVNSRTDTQKIILLQEQVITVI